MSDAAITSIRDLGLHVLTPEEDTANTSSKSTVSHSSINVVAVHGLHGHPFKTWAYSSSMYTEGLPTTPKDPTPACIDEEQERQELGSTWLKDEIHSRYPNARVMTFGYDSSNAELFSPREIASLARKLLGALFAKAASESGSWGAMKFLFIGHDIGGTIIKKLLLIASTERDFLPIALRTQGVIFFGTPHYAPDTTSWELLFLDIGLASIEKAPEHRLRTLQAITKAGAASLHEISEGFDRIAPNFKLLSIIGMKASKRSLSNGPVVPQIAALLNTPNEQTLILEADHHSLCQFTQGGEYGIDTICNFIQSLEDWEVMPWSDSYFRCRRIFTPCCAERDFETNPVTMVEADCEALRAWLQKDGRCSSWLRDTPSIFYIYGQPGSGTSVVASVIMKGLKQRHFMGDGLSTAGQTLLYYAFNCLDGRRQTFRDLLSSLIFQYLVQNTSEFVWFTIERLYDGLVKRGLKWTNEDLWLVFSEVLAHNSDTQVACVIHAIDECEAKDMDFLNRVVSLANEAKSGFRLLVTSHKGTAFGSPCKELNCALAAASFQLSMDSDRLDELSLRDLYMQSVLKGLLENNPSGAIGTGAQIEAVTSNLLKHNGTPLHLQFIRDASLSPLAVLSKPEGILSYLTTPLSLPSLYQLHWGLIGEGTKHAELAWAWNTLGWLLYSLQPLTMSQLAAAVTMSMKPAIDSLELLSQSIPRNFSTLLKHVLGPFITIDGDMHMVRLAHSSIRSFFLNTTIPKNSVNLNDATAWNNQLGAACVQYLQLKGLPLSSSTPKSQSVSVVNVAIGVPDANSGDGARELPSGGSGEGEDDQKREFEINENAGKDNDDDPEDGVGGEGGGESSEGEVEEGQQGQAHGDLTDTIVKGGVVHEKVLTTSDYFQLDPNRSQPDDPRLTQQLFMTNEFRSGAFQFLAYTVQHWIKHCRNAQKATASVVSIGEPEGLMLTCIRLTRDPQKARRFSSLRSYFKYRTSSNPSRPGLLENDEAYSPLVMASWFGMNDAIPQLIQDTSVPERSAALAAAANNGHAAVVNTIFKFHEKHPTEDEDGLEISTALDSAASAGHAYVVGILLANGVDQFELNEALHTAAENGHTRVMRELLDAGAEMVLKDTMDPVEYSAKNGYIAALQSLMALGHQKRPTGYDQEQRALVYHAATEGHLRIVRFLLENNDASSSRYEGIIPRSTRRSTGSYSPLHQAAIGGTPRVVEELVMKGKFDIEEPWEAQWNRTPLHSAISSGRTSCFETLVRLGANIDATDSDGWSTLDQVLWFDSGSLGMLEVLLRNGADPDKTSGTLRSGRTPLNFALTRIPLDGVMIGRLLEESTRLDTQLPDGPDATAIASALHSACEFGCTSMSTIKLISLLLDIAPPGALNAKDIRGRTPLHSGVVNSRSADEAVGVVRFLLGRGASVNEPDEEGFTPLLLAYGGDFLQHIIPVLVEHGANMDTLALNGRTVLHHYVASQAFDINYMYMERILKIGSGPELPGIVAMDVNAPDDDGDTPLHLACKSEGYMYSEVKVKLLLEHGSKVNATSKSGRTPLHYAAMEGSPDAVKQLLELDALVDAPDQEGLTALHIACEGVRGSEEKVKLLLEHGSNVNATSRSGRTPLHYAAMGGRPDVVEQLLELDALVDVPDEEGFTALHLAFERAFLKIAEVLLTYKADTSILSKGGQLPVDTIALRFARKMDDNYSWRAWMDELLELDQLQVRHQLKDTHLKALVNQTDEHGRTLLFFTAATNKEGDTRFLLAFGADQEAKDDVGRGVLDVALHSSMRKILGAVDDHPTAVLAMNECTYLPKWNGVPTFTCNLCERRMGVEFFYQCCQCNTDDFDICSKCYEDGKGCDNTAEHRGEWRSMYTNKGLMSYGGFSPLVEQGVLPKDITATS